MTSPVTPEAQPQGVLLVGSVNLPDAESTFRAAAETLGGRLKRIPDGEVGPRFHWIAFQPDVLAPTAGLERVGAEPIRIGELDVRPLHIADGVDAASLVLPPLGYASAALDSWQVFRTLKDAGVIAPGVRFQVSLPSPLAVTGSFVVPEDRAAFEPVYEAAVWRELDEILAAIPHDELAVQWDSAVEFALIEGAGYVGPYQAWWDGDVWQGVLERVARQAARVPADVELGIHLCYGDSGEHHFVEPADAGVLVEFANRLLPLVPRPFAWLHLPVPIERDDDAYYAPLERLELPAETELYLGLVHREDGIEGARRREAVAARHVGRPFGIATECGMGRAPREQTRSLLEAQGATSAAW